MCGRFTLHTPESELVRFFGPQLLPGLIPFFPAYVPRFNIAPTQSVLTIRTARDNAGCEAVAMRWGLVPAWSKTLTGPPLINARSETITEKPAFRTAFRRRRCLIPADGFYEWQVIGPKQKRPHYITSRTGQPFAFAGLWETWQPPDGPPVESCTILTTGANALMQPLHDRMPVILSPDEFAPWLDPTLTDPATIGPLLDQFPADAMTAFAVSPLVGSVKNQGAGLIERAE